MMCILRACWSEGQYRCVVIKIANTKEDLPQSCNISNLAVSDLSPMEVRTILIGIDGARRALYSTSCRNDISFEMLQNYFLIWQRQDMG
jgi:hypothetical protein